jgi:glycosyltransferase involved in cell wall biosynthesis
MGMDSTKYGGIERFNIELSRQLKSKGYHSVFVYEEYPYVQQFVDDLLSTGAELIVISSHLNKIKFCQNIWNLYRKYDFCTIHAHFTKARFYALPLAALYGIKNRLYTIHSTMEPLREIKLHTRFWYWWMNKVCRVVAVSKQIEQEAKRNWSKAIIKAIYLGIDPNFVDRKVVRNEFDICDDTIVVTTIANFNNVKGLDILCRAVKYLADNHKMNNVIVYVVGQPINEIQELKTLIEQMSITQYIKMEGIKNNIPMYLAASDIYIQASRHEGLPLALMEATAVGLPIVASNVGGIPEVAQENRNAILFPSENALKLAIALEKMINDSKLRNEYGKQSINVYKESFCLKQNISKLIEYYNL